MTRIGIDTGGTFTDIVIVDGEGKIATWKGPADLSLSLGGIPKADHEEGPAVEAIDFILGRARAHGVLAGIHNLTPEYALKMIAKGFRFVTVSSDVRLIVAKAGEVLRAMRAALGPDAAVARPH